MKLFRLLNSWTCKESVFFYLFLVLRDGKKRYTANLKKIRHDYEQDTLRQQADLDESNRFRYFYRKRRANGDVLSSVSLLFR